MFLSLSLQLGCLLVGVEANLARIVVLAHRAVASFSPSHKLSDSCDLFSFSSLFPSSPLFPLLLCVHCWPERAGGGTRPAWRVHPPWCSASSATPESDSNSSKKKKHDKLKGALVISRPLRLRRSRLASSFSHTGTGLRSRTCAPMAICMWHLAQKSIQTSRLEPVRIGYLAPAYRGCSSVPSHLGTTLRSKSCQ